MSTGAGDIDLAPRLEVAQWLNTDVPLDLASLRGKVVLIVAFQLLCPGCVSQGETLEELDDNIREAIVGCLAVDPEGSTSGGFERELDIAV